MERSGVSSVVSGVTMTTVRRLLSRRSHAMALTREGTHAGIVIVCSRGGTPPVRDRARVKNMLRQEQTLCDLESTGWLTQYSSARSQRAQAVNRAMDPARPMQP